MPPLTVTVHAIDAYSASPRGGSAAVRERPTVGPATNFHALEQALLELDPGQATTRATGSAEEVLFVLAGAGTLELAGTSHTLEPESGAYLAPGEDYELQTLSSEPLRLISVRIPDPDPPAPASADPPPPDRPAPPEPDTTQHRAVVRRLADQESEAATTQRKFRIVADPSNGLRSATHFVGYIPTTRAPEHFHTYDEVIYVLDGEGVLHAANTDRPIHAGSCIQLPARTVHCLENTGNSMMRVVAAFRPAGSPAAAYYPDGTPAHPDGMPAHSDGTPAHPGAT
jgi:quercetin dioxygenase-like cupin family protein